MFYYFYSPVPDKAPRLAELQSSKPEPESASTTSLLCDENLDDDCSTDSSESLPSLN